MKVLNLYAGLGGNRKLWDGVEVTAVEINPEIANVYQDFFPGDNVVVDDAHLYLLNHYSEFDFMWSTPPCQSQSKVRMMASKSGSYPPIFPDMKLWEEILFLKYFAKCKFVVENVKPYYTPFVEPNVVLHRHYFWANFEIPYIKFNDKLTHNERGTSHKGAFDLRGYELRHRKDQLIRNSLDPLLGKYIFEQLVKELKDMIK